MTLRSWRRCRNLLQAGQINDDNAQYNVQALVAQAPLVTQRLKDAVDIADDAALKETQVRLFLRITKDEGREF